MVVQDSVTFSVTRVGSHVRHSKALNYPAWTHLLDSSSKTVRHRSSLRHSWSLLKSDRFSLQNSLPVSIMVGPLTLEVDRIGFATPARWAIVYFIHTRGCLRQRDLGLLLQEDCDIA